MNSNILLRMGLDPDDFCDGDETVKSSDGYDYYFEMKRPSECPRCHSKDIIAFGPRERRFNASMNPNIRETIHVRYSRIMCHSCHHASAPKIRGVVGKKQTPRVIDRMIAIDLGRETTIKDIADAYHVSSPYVINTMDALFRDVPRHALTPFLCIDEFGYARSGPGRYPFILVDGSTSRLLDVVKSRQWAYMSPYFRSIPPKERESVTYFSSDMYDPYKSIRNEYFPGAEHVIDMFHIVKQTTFALNVARARSAGRDPFDSAECRFAKVHWQILLLREGEIPAKVFTPAAKGMDPIGFRAAVEAVMAKYPQLLPIWDALQALYSLVDGKAARPYGEEMGWIIRKLLDSGVPQAIDAAGTYKRWERQIRRTFELREKGIMISNSHAEGANSNIASYIKISRGCPDFERFRKRCLLIYGLRDYDQTTNDLTEKAVIGLNKTTNNNQ